MDFLARKADVGGGGDLSLLERGGTTTYSEPLAYATGPTTGAIHSAFSINPDGTTE